MKWLNAIERKMGRRYIPDFMKYLCIAMAGVFILEYLPLSKSAYDLLMFKRTAILQGEIWRVITFIFLPPTASPLWIVISLYFYYFIGVSLEEKWGGARFNLYYLFGVITNIIAGFITGFATSKYLNLSLLLAYAVIFPNDVIHLFFILPVQMKWLGVAYGVLMTIQLITVPWVEKASLLLSLLPVLLFFGDQLWYQLRMTFRWATKWFRMRKF